LFFRDPPFSQASPAPFQAGIHQRKERFPKIRRHEIRHEKGEIKKGLIRIRKGEKAMAKREYKQLSCREMGMDCDFLVRAEGRDEVMRLATEHACEDHNLCEITPEFKDKLSKSTRDIWCDEQKCGYAPKETEGPYWV